MTTLNQQRLGYMCQCGDFHKDAPAEWPAACGCKEDDYIELIPAPVIERHLDYATLAERERCAKIADRFGARRVGKRIRKAP